MFDHILQKVRTIYWQYGNVTCAGYPLNDIDTIGKDGSLNDTSALSIIVRGVCIYRMNEAKLHEYEGQNDDLLFIPPSISFRLFSIH
jgi:hypothetical protein